MPKNEIRISTKICLKMRLFFAVAKIRKNEVMRNVIVFIFVAWFLQGCGRKVGEIPDLDDVNIILFPGEIFEIRGGDSKQYKFTDLRKDGVSELRGKLEGSGVIVRLSKGFLMQSRELQEKDLSKLEEDLKSRGKSITGVIKSTGSRSSLGVSSLKDYLDMLRSNSLNDF